MCLGNDLIRRPPRNRFAFFFWNVIHREDVAANVHFAGDRIVGVAIGKALARRVAPELE